jgi:hypothetical protein
MPSPTMLANFIMTQRNPITGKFCKPFKMWKINSNLIPQTETPSVIKLGYGNLLDTQTGKIYLYRKPTF